MVSLRRLLPDDWALLRDVRLLALSSDPRAFGSFFDREKDYGEDEWRRWLTGEDSAVFGFFDDAGAIAGMTGIALREDDRMYGVAKLWGSWLRADVRGRGYAAELYRARIDWARQHPLVQTIVVSHRESNTASMKANQKHGFLYTHRKAHVWPDGAEEDQLFYELRVK